MILSAEQVADTLGPETPGCDCVGCKGIVAIKKLICDVVTLHDALGLMDYHQRKLTDPSTERPVSAWLAVLMVAASRASAQGFPIEVLDATVEQGINQCHELNPLLHYTANDQSLPL
jgi:hypothetical protein